MSELLNNIHKMFNINRAVLQADTKGSVKFTLEGNATAFRMTKNNDNSFTIKSGNKIYAKNVTAEESKKVLAETQVRFNKINETYKKARLQKQ